MIGGDEQIRRMLIFFHALSDAREEFMDRAEREINRENLDWFQRERFDAIVDGQRRVFRRVEELRLEAAYRSEPVSVRCTPEERSEARRLAFEILEGKASAETAVDHILSDGFPRELFSGSADGG